MALPSKARQQEVYAQVVLTIENDHKWYEATSSYLTPSSWDYFRSACNEHRDNTIKGLSSNEIRFINICLLESRLGRKLVISDFNHAASRYREDAEKYIAQYNQPETTPIKEEIIMNTTTPAFETKHFVFGADVNTLSADNLIDVVKKIENEITTLKTVTSKSTYIDNRIVELTAMLANVVEHLDKK